MIHSCPKSPAAQAAARAADPLLLLRAGQGRHAALFDGAGTDAWGDGAWLFCRDPVATLEVFACGWGRRRDAAGERWRRGDPLSLWSHFLDEAPWLLPPDADRSAARFVTALAYDLKHWVEKLPRRLAWRDEPVLFCAFYDRSIRGKDPLRWSPLPPGEGQGEGAAMSPQPTIGRINPWPSAAPPAGVELEALDRYESYRQRLQRILDYIAAGDVYQVNLARTFTAAVDRAAAPALAEALRRDFPMPYAAYVDLGTVTLVSNSPECFLRINGRDVSTFPIKGTRSTTPNSTLDTQHSTLETDPKEQAEHIMIVDLERNDLGRVCEPGSVEVHGLASAQAYPLLTHMVSEVRGRLRANVRLPEVVRATFPGGSITGAPKVRAMQIIEEIEPRARGFYTGAIGWSDLSGNACFNIAIRTAVLARDSLAYQAGGGIVADSEPAREFAETIVKTEALRWVVTGVDRRPDACNTAAGGA